ncbi:MAG: AMP-binding protein [Betaproteobacteria bacterium]|nr:AMP-binding protein [Betaproteobacteria bacterium]
MRVRFLSRLRACFCPPGCRSTWDALNALAQQEFGVDMPVITGLGATETAPSVCFTRPGTRLAGAIGLPATGNVVKLVPVEGKLEMRVKGPNVTPGYWRQPETTTAAFDEEGYYRLGDAARWIDEGDIAQGLMFDGRIQPRPRRDHRQRAASTSVRCWAAAPTWSSGCMQSRPGTTSSWPDHDMMETKQLMIN